MPRAAGVLLSALTLLAVPAAGTGAQAITIGGSAEATNAFPFTGYAFQTPNRYQQLYAGSSFSQAVLIDAIRFSNVLATEAGLAGGIADGDYLVRLAVTSAAENALSTDFDANLSSHSAVFFSGVLSSAGLRITGDPYLYDPALGTLLLDVTVLSQVPAGWLGFDFTRSTTDGTSRVFHAFPPPFTGPFPVVEDDFGLVTTFETRAFAVVPEPGTVLLVATGLGLLGAAARRRERSRT